VDGHNLTQLAIHSGLLIFVALLHIHIHFSPKWRPSSGG
jgi:hypothetical protein